MSTPIRVVIADDMSLIRAALAALLADQPDVEVVGEACDGKEAVRVADRLRPDVVLMDVSMPVMNGIEATREIAACCPEVKVVGLSMHVSGDMERTMREAGAVSFVTKSAGPDALLAAVRAAA